MESRPPSRFLDHAGAALLRRARGWAAALGCIALVLAGGIPDPAWGQYRSGGYSRPGMGGGAFFTRRPPVGGGGGGFRGPSLSPPLGGGGPPGGGAASR